jgi:hypothetical protein
MYNLGLRLGNKGTSLDVKAVKVQKQTKKHRKFSRIAAVCIHEDNDKGM